jgi:hypothetical protein
MPYATPADLAPFLGGALDDARATAAIEAAGVFLDGVCGRAELGPFPDPPPPGIHTAAIVVAVRYYRNPDAPWAIVGATAEAAAYMSKEIPDLDKYLLGLRTSWGIA